MISAAAGGTDLSVLGHRLMSKDLPGEPALESFFAQIDCKINVSILIFLFDLRILAVAVSPLMKGVSQGANLFPPEMI